MGKSVAVQLTQKGANVVVVARTPKKLEDTVNILKVGLPCFQFKFLCARELNGNSELLPPLHKNFTGLLPI
jgi:shikimate 5-dehydrogenase